MTVNPNEQVPVKELSREEGVVLLDRQARRYLDMSGEQFIADWDAGEFRGNGERPEVVTVAMLLPFGRSD